MTNKEKEQLDYVYEQINKLKLELADCVLNGDFDSALEYIEKIHGFMKVEEFLKS